MKHIPTFLMSFLLVLGSTRGQAQSPSPTLRFAFVSDTHVGQPLTAAEDLERTVADINAMTDVQFVVLTGDITDFGSDTELAQAKSVLDRLNKPWYILPGNHDTKWSENGCNTFRKVFGYEHFSFEAGKYRFIGCGSGPNMRMSPGLVSREDILWLDSTLATLQGSEQPVIFLNHYPLDDALANWYLVIDRLKQVNVQAALCGHGHRNKEMDFEGIPATMGRSNLRVKDPAGGYNLVTIRNDTMTFAERIPGSRTLPDWRTIVLTNHHFAQQTEHYPRPDYSLNTRYPSVRIDWQLEDSSDIGTGVVQAGDRILYANARGQVVALSARDGRVQWRFATGGKVYSTPAVDGHRVVVASTDGYIYCLRRHDGQLLWKVRTEKAIVASPLIYRKTVYLGSSEGKFRALSLTDGSLRWEYASVEGFVESIPVADRQRVYFGSWGSRFYALNRRDGSLAWCWTNGKIRNFSPAACVPVLANGKIFLQTPDRTVTALQADNGREMWKSDAHKGFESMGVSEDKSLIYIKCLRDSVWAISTTGGQPEAKWYVHCGYGYEISPSPIAERDGMLYVPTDDGALYAVSRRAQQVLWAYKLSNAMVNRVCPLGDGAVIVTTMDGKVARLRYADRP